MIIYLILLQFYCLYLINYTVLYIASLFINLCYCEFLSFQKSVIHCQHRNTSPFSLWDRGSCFLSIHSTLGHPQHLWFSNWHFWGIQKSEAAESTGCSAWDRVKEACISLQCTLHLGECTLINKTKCDLVL